MRTPTALARRVSRWQQGLRFPRTQHRTNGACGSEACRRSETLRSTQKRLDELLGISGSPCAHEPPGEHTPPKRGEFEPSTPADAPAGGCTLLPVARTSRGGFTRAAVLGTGVGATSSRRVRRGGRVSRFGVCDERGRVVLRNPLLGFAYAACLRYVRYGAACAMSEEITGTIFEGKKS